MALVETPLSFNVSHTSKKTNSCELRSSNGVPPNWNCYTMEIRVGLSSKLFASILGRAMLELMPGTPRVTKSRSVLFCTPPPPSIIGEVSQALHLCSSSLCFFLLKQKVLSISRLGLYRKGLRIKEENSYKHKHQHYQCNQNEKKNKVKHLVNFIRLTQ